MRGCEDRVRRESEQTWPGVLRRSSALRTDGWIDGQLRLVHTVAMCIQSTVHEVSSHVMLVGSNKLRKAATYAGCPSARRVDLPLHRDRVGNIRLDKFTSRLIEHEVDDTRPSE